MDVNTLNYSAIVSYTWHKNKFSDLLLRSYCDVTMGFFLLRNYVFNICDQRKFFEYK